MPLTVDAATGSGVGTVNDPFGITPDEATLKTWTGQGPSGYGTYELKPDGSLGRYVGDPRTPSTSTGGAGPSTWSDPYSDANGNMVQRNTTTGEASSRLSAPSTGSPAYTTSPRPNFRSSL